MTKLELSTSVLVVGAGPAGLTASLLLAGRGVDSLVVEKHTAVSPLPRARGVHSRAMEILRSCGVEADMRAHQLHIRSGVEWRETLLAPPTQEVQVSGPDFQEVSPCDGVAIAQDVFESVLQSHVQAHDIARVRMGAELIGLEMRPDGVLATVLDRASGRSIAVSAGYVVAADGARSTVRDLLGIGLDGAEDLGSQHGIAFRADLTPYTGAVPRGMYFLTSSGAALFSTHPDNRWAVSVPDFGEPLDPEATVRRCTGIADLQVEVLAASRWTAAARTANQYRSGRVFLIGDAAHQTPPAGATGVSTAMADAHNLCWKLAAVLTGRAGPGLLDTYAAEREPVGHRNVAELGAAWSAMISGGSALTGRSLREIDMGFRYASAAVIPESTGDAERKSSDLKVEDTSEIDYRPEAAPGCRAPHLWVTSDDGRTSALDLFGPNLTLVSGPAGMAWQVGVKAAAASLGTAVHIVEIDAPNWPELYGVSASGAVLVRPDGHVGWRYRRIPHPERPQPEEVLAAAITQILDLTNSLPTNTP